MVLKEVISMPDNWTPLPEDYENAEWTGNKKYQMIPNDDGTVSFVDKTVYTKIEDSFFSAEDANAMNGAINAIMDGTADLYVGKEITVNASITSFTAYTGNMDGVKFYADVTVADMLPNIQARPIIDLTQMSWKDFGKFMMTDSQTGSVRCYFSAQPTKICIKSFVIMSINTGGTE